MLKVGLTGGIGSGKTIVSKVFEILGVPVYNSDTMAKYLMNSSPVIKNKLIENFGKDVCNNDGSLKRQFLANEVFDNSVKLTILNGIIHPEVRKHFQNWLQDKNKYQYIIKEAAILIESDTYKELDKLILVTADENTRIKRVMNRDDRTEDEVKARMKNQLNDDQKIKYADHIIKNNKGDFILEQILEIHNQLIKIN